MESNLRLIHCYIILTYGLQIKKLRREMSPVKRLNTIINTTQCQKKEIKWIEMLFADTNI